MPIFRVLYALLIHSIQIIEFLKRILCVEKRNSCHSGNGMFVLCIFIIYWIFVFSIVPIVTINHLICFALLLLLLFILISFHFIVDIFIGLSLQNTMFFRHENTVECPSWICLHLSMYPAFFYQTKCITFLPLSGQLSDKTGNTYPFDGILIQYYDFIVRG